MGLLSEGEALSWEETAKNAEHVRYYGVQQFINIYRCSKDRSGDRLLWGDEVEYNVVRLDDDARTARVCPRADELLPVLQAPEVRGEKGLTASWKPENGGYMIEATPGSPFSDDLDKLPEVEANMRKRRQELQDHLAPGEDAITMSTFPRLGCCPYTYPEYYPHPWDSVTKSIFWTDKATTQIHPRFILYNKHTRLRRGDKVIINVPLYRDVNTDMDRQLLDATPEVLAAAGEEEAKSAAKPGHIYMDGMGFGMGLSCLQVTFQTPDMGEAEYLYDQLVSLCPIFLALTATSPIFRGYLADIDCRWDIISCAMDDRKPHERAPGGIPKSRYASVSAYISRLSSDYGYNDVKLLCHADSYDRMLKAGVKKPLAKHVSHLFIRDAIVTIKDRRFDDEHDNTHFENIQSSNWQTLRFKPPPSDNNSIGWRVEFRPCEIQFTDFENAATAVFIKVITKLILAKRLNFMIPISRVDENMARAHRRDAVRRERFHFRSNVLTGGDEANHQPPNIREMTADQIINGAPELDFPGLLPMVEEYLSEQNLSASTRSTLSNYWKLFRLRASGRLKTNARFMRDIVMNHDEYKRDSVVSDSIAYDVMREVVDIQKTGVCRDKALYGDLVTLI